MFLYMRKTYLGKILMIQMLIYPTSPSYSPVVGKGFLQSPQKYCHQATGILTDFKHLILVFRGQLGLKWETGEVKG